MHGFWSSWRWQSTCRRGVGDKGAKQAVEAVVYEGEIAGRLYQCRARRWRTKKAYLSMTRTVDEIEIMQRIKASLDQRHFEPREDFRRCIEPQIQTKRVGFVITMTIDR